jgi:DNA-binding CsgD family transcriptional regulator
MKPSGSGEHTLHTAMQSIGAARGQARQFKRRFDTSLVPMVLVDSDRRYVAANAASRLLFRLSLAEMLALRIEDLTPPHMVERMDEAWDALMEDGLVAGEYDVGLPDGSELKIVYCALANILPGKHLIVFIPAEWSADELEEVVGAGDAPPSGRLSPRERQVLGLIASGADLQQIADELTLSVATVRTHARNALRKLGARNRAQAIALAMQHGLIEPGEASGWGPGSAV